MYKNFNITESEKEQILNRLKENGYGQPINEQKVKPTQKPVANPELVKKWETLKELTNNLVSQVPAYVSKTLPNMIISNTTGENGGYHQQSNLQYRNIGVDTLTFNTTNKQVIHGKLKYSIEDRNSVDTQDINQFAQDINKTMPSNINVYPTGYGTYNYGVTFMYSMTEMNTATKLKLFQQIDPNAGEQIINDLKGLYYKSTDRERSELTKLSNELLVLTGKQQPAAQGQQPTQQKPLNEGQEILKDVFKTLIK